MRALEALIVVMVAWGALAFGAVYPWAYWPLVITCAGVGVWSLFAVGRQSWGSPDGVSLWMGVALLAIAFQAVPLPYGIFVRLTPSADSYLEQQILSYQLVRPGWHPLSISPQKTLTALAIVSAMTLGYTGLVRVLARMSVETLVNRLIVLGVGLAFLAVVQAAAVDIENPTVYGFWQTRQRTVPYGPFINRNHFAGWMLMLIPIAIGYSFAVFRASPRPRRRTVRDWLMWLTRPEASRFALVAFTVVVMSTALVLSRSRSGIVSLGAAVVTVGIAVMVTRHGSVRGLAAVYLTALLGAPIVWVGTDLITDRFSAVTTDLPGRWQAWEDTTRIISDYPVFGVGAGAYGDAMLQYQSFDRYVHYEQAHNDYIEVLAEGGLFVALPVLLAMFSLMRLAIKRLREEDEDGLRPWIRLGALGGLVGIAAQSLVEFSLQIPGNAVLLVVTAALAVHRGPEPREDSRGT